MRLRHSSPAIARLMLVVAVALGLVAAPAQAQGWAVSQGSPVIVHGTGICTVGYNDFARRRSFVGAHCGAEGSRVEIFDPRTGARSGAVGTLYRSKLYDGHLSNDWAAIQWDPGVRLGANGKSGNGWVHPNDLLLGETVCYFGQTSHARGGQTCGKFAGSADNTFFVDVPPTRPGDSGGPMWVPGRGFVGVVSSMWTSVPLLGFRPHNFVVGVVPHDGPAVPEPRLIGVWAQNTFMPGLTGPVGEAVRRIFDAIFRVLGSLGFRVPTMVNYS